MMLNTPPPNAFFEHPPRNNVLTPLDKSSVNRELCQQLAQIFLIFCKQVLWTSEHLATGVDPIWPRRLTDRMWGTVVTLLHQQLPATLLKDVNLDVLPRTPAQGV